jgi:PAS domain S-box-containing protein
MTLANESPSELTELERFRLLVSGISDYAIYMLDLDGYVSSWNDGARRFKGYIESEILGSHFSRFYTLEDQATGLPEHALSVAREMGKFESEGWRVRKDGTRFWASVVVDSLRNDQGKMIGFAKITRDVTERKQASEKLLQSERQFRFLVQGVTDYAIYMIGPTGLITSWNAGAQRIKGYTAAEAIGTHFSRFYTPEDSLDGLPERALATALQSGRFEREGWRVRKDGSRFMAHVVIDPIYDDEKELIGFAKVTRDMTEKEESAARLKQTELALQQSRKLETIGKLTGGVAHDFNNLLQVISGNLHLLSSEVSGNDRAEKRLARAMGGVTRGAKLATQLLAFGRRQPLEPKVTNISRLLFNFEDLLARSLGEAVEIEIIASAGLWNTLIDTVQIENALLNLAINARDAMKGVGKLTIEAGNAFLDDEYASKHAEVSAGQYVMLAVTDNGSGMSSETIAQAFEPFFSTKPEGEGSGLGLSMVYGFVKQSGGHINIYSEIGHGTTIKLYFPRAHESEDVVSEPKVENVVGGTETILVAEDDEEVRVTVVELLRELGYQVLKASDATGALAIIDSGVKIDLLFSDVVMPGPLRSPELARKARARQPHIAVLFTSGYTQNAIVHGGRLDAGVELLSKPYNREALAKKVRHVLANQRQRDALILAPSNVGLNPAAEPVVNRLSVLLVEDDDAIRETTMEIIGLLGHTVYQASNAIDGLARLSADDIDILMTDIGLADMSGLELAKLARKQWPTIGVVFASGQGLPVDFPNAIVLSKPYDSLNIAAALRRVTTK